MTLEEYANYLIKKNPRIRVDDAIGMAEEMFSLRGDKRLPPMTKFELYYQDDLNLDPIQIFEYDDSVEFEKTFVKKEDNEEG